MDTAKRNPPKPPLFAWGLLWLSQFLIIGCLTSIPTIALHRPSRPGLPPPVPDWHVPLLVAAVFASATTWQGWYTRNNDKGRFQPKPQLDPATRKKQKWILGLILGGLPLLMECLFVFGLGNQVDWPLLLALNAGMAAGWGLLMWTTHLMPDPPGPNADPLAPEAVPTIIEKPTLEPVLEIAYAERGRAGLPPVLAWILTFAGASAMAVALIAGVMGRFWDALSPLGIPMALLIALAITAADRMQRKRSRPTTKPAQNVTGFLVSFLAIQVMLRVLDFNPHEDWLRLLALDAGALVAYGFVRWTLTLPVTTPAVAPASAELKWLPEGGVALATPTEIVFLEPIWWRILCGIVVLSLFGSMTLFMAVMTFAPTLLDPRFAHSGIDAMRLTTAFGMAISAGMTYLSLTFSARMNFALTLSPVHTNSSSGSHCRILGVSPMEFLFICSPWRA